MTWNTVTPSDDGWRLIIDHWRRTGEWNSSNGPRPGEPGCRVPSHLLIADANSVAPDFPPGTATVETIAPKLNGAEVASDVAFPWDYTQTGKLKVKSYANTYNGLLQLGYTWQHDTFHDWKLANGQQLSDGLARELREQVLRRIGVDPGIDNVRQAAERLCEAHSFDPVVDYLANVQPMWDGESRLDTWLTAYLGADDTPLNRAIGSRVLIAAVRRARAPSTKFDEITVFESEEGTSKSAAIAMLAGADNFSDQTILGKHMTDRDIQEKFKGIWLYEIADMTGMVKSEVEAVKAMASRITDRGRPAYGHFVVRQPRRCVLFATTNDDTYLRSQTGNRRFLPVKVAIIHSIDIDALSRDRDQLWAEAAAREAAGESILLPKELWGVARAAQEARLVEDPWDDVLRSVTGTLHDISGADGYRQEERITTNKLLLDYLRLPVEKCNDVTAKRLVHVMKRLGWERSKDPIRIGNEKLRGFRRPYPPPSDDPSQENTE